MNEKDWLEERRNYFKDYNTKRDEWEKEGAFKVEWDNDSKTSFFKEYLPEHLRQYIQPHEKNFHGVAMYTKDCFHCTAHEEDSFQCDLCHMRFAYLRLHITDAMGKEWEEELPIHSCHKSQEYLNLILYATFI